MHLATPQSAPTFGSHPGARFLGDNQIDTAHGIDSLFILPLRIIPLTTEVLSRSRLIKNSSLVGVIELYRERGSGSGQIAVHDLPIHFQWKNGASHPDFGLLQTLALLPSYDVYSLRRSLRDLGVPVNAHRDLRLSDEKSRELAGYMRQFTMPLLRHIYGNNGAEVARFEDLVSLFADPDVAKARARLKLMADKLKITIDLIPRFIEDYADIFLSLSYYNHCLDRLEPLLEAFLLAARHLRKIFHIRTDAALSGELERIERQIVGLTGFLRRSFQDFATMSQDLWRNLSAAKFEQVKAYVENAQARIGGVLCGLTVKMDTWVARFPNPLAGSPGAKSEFIMSDMRPGLAGVVEIARGRDMLEPIPLSGGARLPFPPPMALADATLH